MELAENGLAGCPFCATHCSFQRVPFDGSQYAGGHYVECDNRTCRASSVLLKMADAEMAMTKLRELWNRREHSGDAPPVAATPPKFPTMLRKQWSGQEVQDWIDQHWHKGVGA